MGTFEKSVQSEEAVVAAQWAEWRSSRRRLLKMGAFAGGLAAAGVLGSAGPFARGAAARGTPKAGGVVTMSLADADVASFDPIAIFDNMSIWTQLLIYDQLLRPAADGASVEPSLAEKWEKSDDGLTYTFHLRDATFHDGSTVTAEDAAFSIDRAAHDPTSQNGFIFSAIDSLTATDPKTLTIKLKNPWAPLEADLALYGASILPKKLVTAQGADFFNKPVGSGAFVFASWERDVQIKLTRYAAYWETGKPYLDAVTLKVLTDSNARMLEFQGGDLDIASLVPYSQLEGLRGNAAVTVVPDAVARIDYCAMNLLRKPFDDKLLRQAVNYAVDKDAIIKNVLFGNGVAANTYLPRMAYHDDAAPGYPFNLQKAKDLVAQSSAKDGFKAELLINAGDAVAAQVAQLISADLIAIGGKITIASLDPATVNDRYTKALD
ncbi:MAG: ABC transporter substrate-binding protein, partial [Thermomicrobiales bacterium]